MAFVDYHAARRIKAMREELGLSSPEALAHEIRLQAVIADWGRRGTVDAHTIRRIEKRGHVPSIRIQFVLAMFFGVRMRELWLPGAAQPAQETAQETAA